MSVAGLPQLPRVFAAGIAGIRGLGDSWCAMRRGGRPPLRSLLRVAAPVIGGGRLGLASLGPRQRSPDLSARSAQRPAHIPVMQ